MGEVCVGARTYPLRVVTMGNASAPAAVGFFAGVHGLERVGTQVLLAFVGSLIARLHWDEVLHRQLENVRLVFMPLVNPAGMALGTRANANGVDLMRNAPVESAERVAFLAGGHRLSPRLPWYRGRRGAPMEVEAQALCAIVEEELLSRPVAFALDCHSGFGLRDRIWFPHAHTRAPFARVPEVHSLMQLFDETCPGHPYLFEPQCRHYLTHGDLWDYLLGRGPAGHLFIPLTLEMGSWRWIRKSPRQALSLLGMFNPLPRDRLQRVRRNHLLWLNFLCRAASTAPHWLPTGGERSRREREARAMWFS